MQVIVIFYCVTTRHSWDSKWAIFPGVNHALFRDLTNWQRVKGTSILILIYCICQTTIDWLALTNFPSLHIPQLKTGLLYLQRSPFSADIGEQPQSNQLWHGSNHSGASFPEACQSNRQLRRLQEHTPSWNLALESGARGNDKIRTPNGLLECLAVGVRIRLWERWMALH